MSALLQFTTTLATETCCSCGILFAMPNDYRQQRLNDHEAFWCPAGHRQYYTGKSDAEKLRDQLAAEKHKTEQAQALAAHRLTRIEDEQRAAQRIARRLSATQGVVTRHKRKIAAGKCPCCSAAFKDLASHMKNRHPNWNPEKEAEVRANV